MDRDRDRAFGREVSRAVTCNCPLQSLYENKMAGKTLNVGLGLKSEKKLKAKRKLWLFLHQTSYSVGYRMSLVTSRDSFDLTEHTVQQFPDRKEKARN